MRVETLEFREGKSDKIYTLSVEPADHLSPGFFNVVAKFGRRGATMQKAVKNKAPMLETEAIKLWHKVLNEKQAEGYKPVIGSAEIDAAKAAIRNVAPKLTKEEQVRARIHDETLEWQRQQQASKRINHQLLNPVENPKPYLEDDKWWMEPKKDGVRALLRKNGLNVDAVSRTWLPVVVDDDIRIAMLKYSDCVLDGEMCGKVFWAFDILKVGDKVLTDKPYWERKQFLDANFGGKANYGALRVVKTSRTTSEKSHDFKKYLSAGEEGVVFKDKYARYQQGRPTKLGVALKFKFVATATVKVVPKAKPDEKSSFEAAVLRDGKLESVGTVTVPPNKKAPAIGKMVEVRYLYAHRNGCIVQAVYLGERADKKQPDDYESLQFKAEARPIPVSEADSEATKPCICGHLKLRHDKKRGKLDGFCRDCVCECFEPEETGSDFAEPDPEPETEPETPASTPAPVVLAAAAASGPDSGKIPPVAGPKNALQAPAATPAAAQQPERRPTPQIAPQQMTARPRIQRVPLEQSPLF